MTDHASPSPVPERGTDAAPRHRLVSYAALAALGCSTLAVLSLLEWEGVWAGTRFPGLIAAILLSWIGIPLALMDRPVPMAMRAGWALLCFVYGPGLLLLVGNAILILYGP